MACGYRFRPTDKELIEYFLLKRASEKPLPYDDVIIDCDVYRKEPEQIFKNTTEKIVYFFTTLKKKSGRFHRTVCIKDKNNNITVGTWKGQTIGTPIMDGQGRVIGRMRNLVYQTKLEHPKHYRYLMKEFSLDGPTLRCAKVKDMVLCRIKRKATKEKREYNNDGEVESAVENSGYTNVGVVPISDAIWEPRVTVERTFGNVTNQEENTIQSDHGSGQLENSGYTNVGDVQISDAVWEPRATVEGTFGNYTNEEDNVMQSDHGSVQWIDSFKEELMKLQFDIHQENLSDQSLLFLPNSSIWD